jgi:hypothetical protein
LRVSAGITPDFLQIVLKNNERHVYGVLDIVNKKSGDSGSIDELGKLKWL